MSNFFEVFNISQNYTLEQLKKSYINIVENLFKSNKTNVEKKLLASKYKELYLIAKQQKLNQSKQLNLPKSYFYSSSTISTSHIEPNGVIHTTQQNYINNNGKQEKNIDEYKKLPNGQIIPINHASNENKQKKIKN